MQQKWIDRPATDTDWFDLTLALSNGFFRRHFSLIAKAAPPLFGFAIFVFYFYRNHFYPSFDLFQFSSLLLAAAAIGFAIIGALVVPLFLPGPWISANFDRAHAERGYDHSSEAPISQTTPKAPSGGRVESLCKGLSDMDAARAATGQGWPFAARPWNDDGARGPDEVGPDGRGRDLLLTFGASAKSEPP